VKKQDDTIAPDEEVTGTDVVLCLDAADGKTLWRFEQKSRPDYSGGSSTPCVVDGRVYVLGSDADLYCLDANTGSEIWQRKLGTGVRHTSVAVVDDTVIAAVGPLTALNAENGKTLWEQEGVPNTEASPSIWRSGGHSYLLCNSKQNLSCVKLSDGSIAWTVPGGNSSSAAVSGDHMVVYTGPKGRGLAAYTLTPLAAEQIWAIERPNRESSPLIYEGHVYAVGGQQASCVDLSSGEIKWQADVSTDMTSPVAADGKIISASIHSLTMFAATPEKYTLLGSANPPVGRCVSPAIADGKLYMRMGPGVLCYDLMVDPGESP
jgi:outer membrane protein assembly factor BamB